MGRQGVRPRVCDGCGSVSHVVPFVCEGCKARVELPWTERHKYGTPYPEGWVSAFQHGPDPDDGDGEGLFCSWRCAAKYTERRAAVPEEEGDAVLREREHNILDLLGPNAAEHLEPIE